VLDSETNILRTSLTEILHGAEANSRLAGQEIPPTFMDPEESLQCPQEPGTGPCPEPEESNSRHYNLFA
jgi:hypothetical protein